MEEKILEKACVANIIENHLRNMKILGEKPLSLPPFTEGVAPPSALPSGAPPPAHVPPTLPVAIAAANPNPIPNPPNPVPPPDPPNNNYLQGMSLFAKVYSSVFIKTDTTDTNFDKRFAIYENSYSSVKFDDEILPGNIYLPLFLDKAEKFISEKALEHCKKCGLDKNENFNILYDITRYVMGASQIAHMRNEIKQPVAKVSGPPVGGANAPRTNMTYKTLFDEIFVPVRFGVEDLIKTFEKRRR